MKLRENKLIRDCLENFTNYNDVSLLDGSSGFLLFLLNLYLIEKDDFYEQKAIEVLYQTDFNFSISNYNRGLWTGVIGLSYVINLWGRYSCNDIFKNLDLQLTEASKKIIDTYLNEEIKNYSDSTTYDILYGLAGIIIFIKYHPLFKTERNLDQCLSKLVNKIIRNNDNFKLFFSNFESKEAKNLDKTVIINLSLSHGMVSLLNSSLLLESMDIIVPNKLNIIYQDFIDNITWIPEYAEVDLQCNKDVKFLYSRDNENFSWCYGVYGHYIFQRNKGLNFSIYLKDRLLVRVNEFINNETLETNNVCFCHGLAGLLYSCHDRYSTKDIQKCCRLLESNYFNNKVLDEYSIWGVLDGKIGILLSYIAIKYQRKIIGEEIFGIFK